MWTSNTEFSLRLENQISFSSTYCVQRLHNHRLALRCFPICGGHHDRLHTCGQPVTVTISCLAGLESPLATAEGFDVDQWCCLGEFKLKSDSPLITETIAGRDLGPLLQRSAQHPPQLHWGRLVSRSPPKHHPRGGTVFRGIFEFNGEGSLWTLFNDPVTSSHYTFSITLCTVQHNAKRPLSSLQHPHLLETWFADNQFEPVAHFDTTTFSVSTTIETPLPPPPKYARPSMSLPSATTDQPSGRVVQIRSRDVRDVSSAVERVVTLADPHPATTPAHPTHASAEQTPLSQLTQVDTQEVLDAIAEIQSQPVPVQPTRSLQSVQSLAKPVQEDPFAPFLFAGENLTASLLKKVVDFVPSLRSMDREKEVLEAVWGAEESAGSSFIPSDVIADPQSLQREEMSLFFWFFSQRESVQQTMRRHLLTQNQSSSSSSNGHTSPRSSSWPSLLDIDFPYEVPVVYRDTSLTFFSLVDDLLGLQRAEEHLHNLYKYHPFKRQIIQHRLQPLRHLSGVLRGQVAVPMVVETAALYALYETAQTAIEEEEVIHRLWRDALFSEPVLTTAGTDEVAGAADEAMVEDDVDEKDDDRVLVESERLRKEEEHTAATMLLSLVADYLNDKAQHSTAAVKEEEGEGGEGEDERGSSKEKSSERGRKSGKRRKRSSIEETPIDDEVNENGRSNGHEEEHGNEEEAMVPIKRQTRGDVKLSPTSTINTGEEQSSVVDVMMSPGARKRARR